ncbi:AraC family transcriptional regulator [Streptomyces roseolus]|uniref:AraC family transcriptional regulator n=1 Tax=Streptomyces roseolus TaxID=67358 RepID=UPI00167AE2C8|nr:AraC family transcriptional regulator [Streptomyces roseolus]GGR25931.1 AraC family transcriptional regulator [Streptomyces roseolus]
MDVLADIMAATRFTGVLLNQLRSGRPDWGCGIAPMPTAGFHLVAEGVCWLRVPGRAPLRLVPGDLVLLPHGDPHELTGTPEAVAVAYPDLEAAHPPGREGVVDLGGDGPVVRVVCGKFAHEGTAGRHPVLAALPRVVHLPGMSADPELQATVRLMMAETTRRRPGAQALATRLTDVLFVQAVRAWLERGADGEPGEPSWLTALRDPRIGTSLSLMHEEPQRAWTVEGLARAVTMSRAAFARRFKDLVGSTPLAYLAELRVDLAARLLRDTDSPVGDIARSVGYASEFAFSRAFSRRHGLPPGRYRRHVPAPVGT